MGKKSAARVAARGLAGLIACGTVPMAWAAEGGAVTVREQKNLMVDGRLETWQLVWQGKISAVCGPDDREMSLTCPCSGFAYGETGRLFLLRQRDHRLIERLDLGPFFDLGTLTPLDVSPTPIKDQAVLARWPVESGDMAAGRIDRPDFTAEIQRRPAPVVMQLGDYNRDGLETKFLLQVGTEPCGKREDVAIGITARHPTLHALTTVEHPKKPLVLPTFAWDALLNNPGRSTVETWPCGDHGSQTSTELTLSTQEGGIHVTKRQYSCDKNMNRGRLLSKEIL